MCPYTPTHTRRHRLPSAAHHGPLYLPQPPSSHPPTNIWTCRGLGGLQVGELRPKGTQCTPGPAAVCCCHRRPYGEQKSNLCWGASLAGTNHSPEKGERAEGREDPWRLVQVEAHLGLPMSPMAQAERPWVPQISFLWEAHTFGPNPEPLAVLMFTVQPLGLAHLRSELMMALPAGVNQSLGRPKPPGRRQQSPERPSLTGSGDHSWGPGWPPLPPICQHSSEAASSRPGAGDRWQPWLAEAFPTQTQC